MTRLGSPMAMTVAELGRDALTQQFEPKLVLWMLGEPEVAFRGFSQFGWLSTLKNSARSWSLILSVASIVFSRPESRFQKFGPRTVLRPPVPLDPGGGMQKKVCVFVTFTQL